MVQFTTGPGRWDAAGYGRICFPHLGIGTSPSKSERYFTSGNERTVFDFNPDGKDMSSGTGYHLTKNDTFGFLNEIMNMNMVKAFPFNQLTNFSLLISILRDYRRTKLST